MSLQVVELAIEHVIAVAEPFTYNTTFEAFDPMWLALTYRFRMVPPLVIGISVPVEVEHDVEVPLLLGTM
jgi:hypothetical protein